MSLAPPSLRMDAVARGRLVARSLAGSWRSSPPQADLSPEELSVVGPILERQGSSGLAWATIRGTPLAELPEAGGLKDGFRHHTLQARLLEHFLLQAVPYFRDQGIEPMLAKGWAVGRLYPEAGRRPYGDLDLMVLPSDFQKAVLAQGSSDAPMARAELHQGFNELRDRSPKELFGRSRLETLTQPETLNGIQIRVFSPEDHLRLLALHALEHGLARPLWLCDLGVVLESLPGDFDWELCMWGEPWLSAGVRSALGLARSLLGVDLEEAGVPGPWREPPPPPWLETAALGALGADAHYMDLPDFGPLLNRPRGLLRAARLRWANPLEATFRMEAPWDEMPRFAVQAVDYLVRGVGFLGDLPGYLEQTREAGGEEESPES